MYTFLKSLTIMFMKTNYWEEYLDIIERKEQEDKENYIMKI
jgi:hypothetical protein